MANFSPPINPVGRYLPAYMSNLYGGSWVDHWNTCIYGSPTQTGADVLANCTGYAQGRMITIYNEITGYNPAQTQTTPFSSLNGNPVQTTAGIPDGWIERAQAAGLVIQSEPREGSVFVTDDHVGVVEKYDNGNWWVSESGYNADPYLYQQSLYKDTQNRWCSSYSSPSKIIHGFILIPNVQPGPGPTPGGSSKKWLYYMKNWNNVI